MRATYTLPRFAGACLALAGAFALCEADALAQHCAAPPNGTPTAANMDQAKKAMAAGVTFMQDPEGPRYEEAYPQFKRAYELSGSLNALQNMALCAEKLELDGEAIECFKRYVEAKGGDIAPEDKQQIESDLKTLETGVAYVSISSDLPNVTLQDTRTPRRGAVVRNSYKLGSSVLKLGLHPGEHTLVASVAGHPDQKWTLELKSGEKLSKEFLFDVGKPVTAEGFTAEDAGLKPKEDTKDDAGKGSSGGGLPASVWVAGSLTAAAGIGWGVTGGLALTKKSAFEKANTMENAATGTDLAAQQKTVKTFNLIADVAMGVTAAGAITTVILAVTHKPAAAAPATSAFGRDWLLAPMLDREAAGIAATGRF